MPNTQAFAKTATLVIAILVVLSAIAGLRGKGRRKSGGQLQVTRLNDFYKDLRERLESGLLDKAQLKALRKQQAKAENSRRRARPRTRAGYSYWTSMATSKPRPPKACAMKSPRC